MKVLILSLDQTGVHDRDLYGIEINVRPGPAVNDKKRESFAGGL